MTGAVSKIDITGRNGLTLTEAWKDGPVNYIGLFVSGFPNMFQVNGPGSRTCLIVDPIPVGRSTYRDVPRSQPRCSPT